MLPYLRYGVNTSQVTPVESPPNPPSGGLSHTLVGMANRSSQKPSDATDEPVEETPAPVKMVTVQANLAALGIPRNRRETVALTPLIAGAIKNGIFSRIDDVPPPE
jgi:hypothetical protein